MIKKDKRLDRKMGAKEMGENSKADFAQSLLSPCTAQMPETGGAECQRNSVSLGVLRSILKQLVLIILPPIILPDFSVHNVSV